MRPSLGEVIRAIVDDAGAGVSSNDAADYLHTVVPIAYADLVLLHGRWSTYAERAMSRLSSSGYRGPVAKVFSARKNGVEKLVSALEQLS